MKKTIEYINLENGEIEETEETLPNALPARLSNKCETLYKATVTGKRNNGKTEGSVEMDNPIEAKKQVKEEVMDYLLTDSMGPQWIKADISMEQIRGKTQNEVVAEYEEDLYGISSKKKDGSRNGQKNTSNNGVKDEQSK